MNNVAAWFFSSYILLQLFTDIFCWIFFCVKCQVESVFEMMKAARTSYQKLSDF